MENSQDSEEKEYEKETEIATSRTLLFELLWINDLLNSYYLILSSTTFSQVHSRFKDVKIIPIFCTLFLMRTMRHKIAIEVCFPLTNSV